MNWKKQLTKGLPGIFSNGKDVENKSDEELKARLYQEIGQLKVELDWLKKKLPSSVEAKRTLVEAGNKKISIARPQRIIRFEPLNALLQSDGRKFFEFGVNEVDR